MKIPKHWTFKSDEIAKNFDSHVREQLPWYDVAQDIVSHFVRSLAPEAAKVYDLGCSTGNLELACSDTIDQKKLVWTPIDDSSQMISEYKGKFQPVLADIASYDYFNFDLAICFLSLMFIHPSRRRKMISQLYSKMNDYGAIIIFDKIVSSGGYLGAIQSRLSMSMKLSQGVAASEILQKEISLIGHQMPIDYSEFEDYSIFKIFKVGEFEGFIIRK